VIILDNQEFHTFSDDMKKMKGELTASMEDYLEMICRLSKDNGYTRIYELSNALNVQPPSATKMVQKLAELKLLKYERYGIILLEKEGIELGLLLLRRHEMVESLLKILGVSDEFILSETEKIEHTISDDTLKCLSNFIVFIRNNPNVLKEFNKS
jgi:Mn-dependent DtxR family transcriptional regulator